MSAIAPRASEPEVPEPERTAPPEEPHREIEPRLPEEMPLEEPEKTRVDLPDEQPPLDPRQAVDARAELPQCAGSEKAR
jgi:hypothetical protein